MADAATATPGDAHFNYAPAPTSRIFGWGTLAVMAAFLINNILTFWVGWTGVAPLLGWESSGGIGWQAFVQLGIYALALFLAVRYALARGDAPLREDAKAISDWNAFLVRAAFWVVVLVGLADFVISFMRVEGMLAEYVGAEMESQLGKSQFRGVYVHGPLVVLGILMAMVTRTLGFHWLALLVVAAELTIVFSRFIFSYEQAFQADLVRFWYAALFLFASAYTLLEDGHVRVDVFYAGFSRRSKAVVNSVGSILLGMSLCWTVLLLGMWGKSSVINSPILVYEVTQSVFGLYLKYFMAGFLAVFAVTMMVQFVSMFFDGIADRRGEPGARERSTEITH